MKLLVLGSGAGGGFPLWNCHCRLCSDFRRGDLDASARTQSSIAISQDGRPGEGWLLINASPDLPQQIAPRRRCSQLMRAMRRCVPSCCWTRGCTMSPGC